MLFNSAAFVVFLCFVFAIHWLMHRKSVRVQNVLLIAAGCLFYGSWDWKFLGLLVVSGTIDYFISKKISSSSENSTRKRWMYLSLLLNIGVLFYFKYLGFFAEEFTRLLNGAGMQSGNITEAVILPFGISYYTFLKFGYILDVWRGKAEAEKDVVNYFTFLLFFPYMLAGPVERARNMFPQLKEKRFFNRDFAVAGLRMLLWGFFKKVVIADRLGQVVNPVFEHSATYSGSAVAFAVILFHVQLYADFSGYSDIARGVAQLFGIKIMNNFERPFYSPSLRKYWRRWHISVSTWFNEYLFTPLAIETRNWGSFGMYFSIMITFIAIGLWHGAQWNFILWGAMMGTLICIEQALDKKVKLPQWTSVILVNFFIIYCLIWFQSKTIGQALLIHENIFTSWNTGAGIGSALSDVFASSGFLFVFVIALLVFIFGDAFSHRIIPQLSAKPKLVRWFGYYAILLMIVFLGVSMNAPAFVYFKF